MAWPGRRRRLLPPAGLRRFLALALVALLVLAGGVFAAVPSVRDSVLEFFGLRGRRSSGVRPPGRTGPGSARPRSAHHARTCPRRARLRAARPPRRLPGSDFAESKLRLSDNVLLVERSNLLVRVEGAFGRERRSRWLALRSSELRAWELPALTAAVKGWFSGTVLF